MEPKFQTSFIPKKPIISMSGPSIAVTRSTSIFSIIAVILFLLAIATSGGLYLYKNVLNGQISDDDKSLNDARAAFQPEKIQELVDANARIMAAKTLLGNHVAVSQILTMLQNLTVKKIRFTDVEYTGATKDNPPALIAEGEAATYNALAEQQDIFAKNEFLKNPQFSNFNLNENGNVVMKFSATIVPSAVSYKNLVQVSSQ